jgi:hypothetical protein
MDAVSVIARNLLLSFVTALLLAGAARADSSPEPGIDLRVRIDEGAVFASSKSQRNDESEGTIGPPVAYADLICSLVMTSKTP